MPRTREIATSTPRPEVEDVSANGRPLHIALWACPRSRSTLIARSFEQLEGALLIDEPFYGPYLMSRGHKHPLRDTVIAHTETDAARVVGRITSDKLPRGFSFSFQKHHPKNVLPEFGRSWLARLRHVILLRHPSEIIDSYHRIVAQVDAHDIGIHELKDMFLVIRKTTGEAPLVVHSEDLIADPPYFLAALCGVLGVTYSPRMLRWEPDLGGSQLLFTGRLRPVADIWYHSLARSTGFESRQPRRRRLPSRYERILNECLPPYEALVKHCWRIHRSSLAEVSGPGTGRDSGDEL